MTHRTNKKNKTISDIRTENYDDDKVLRDIRTLFEPEEDYCKPIKIADAFDGNYIQNGNNGHKNKSLSIKDYLEEIKPYLIDLINDLKTKN